MFGDETRQKEGGEKRERRVMYDGKKEARSVSGDAIERQRRSVTRERRGRDDTTAMQREGN